MTRYQVPREETSISWTKMSEQVYSEIDIYYFTWPLKKQAAFE